MAVLAQYNSEKFCNISKNYLQNIANLGGFPVEKPNQLSIPLNLEGTKRAFIPYVTENSEIQFKINDSLVKGK